MRLFNFITIWVIINPVLGQDFSSNRITPMLNAQQELAQALFQTKIYKNLDCPPKLTKPTSFSFSFLDSIPLNPNAEEQFLQEIIHTDCRLFYSVVKSHLWAEKIYTPLFAQAGLDAKYQLLPLTMSAHNPNLKYLGDKSGAWQLSYVNARKYGLEINQWYDERNDMKASTRASIAYLKFLQQYYLNNEMLVITAFYTSIPYVNKTLNQLEDVNPTTFYLALSPEVQGYFSYLKSWANWMENFDYKVASTPPVKWTEVFSNDTLSFAIISEFMNIPFENLQLMNPVFVGETVIPKSSHRFYLPKEKAASFNQKYADFIAFQKKEKQRKADQLARLKKQMESGIPDLEKYKAVTYTVKSGDVLGKIASNNNVKVSHIKQWNNLKSDRINIGQKLVLYVPKNEQTTLPPETADNKIETKPTVAKPGKGTPTIYTVKNGESLWLIAKKFPGVSAENIMEWNGCTDKIAPGMKLEIYDLLKQ
tara:strand:- start:150 stop:1583 length:1434 start_codon:yes stop_codon:yes gene_type:complete